MSPGAWPPPSSPPAACPRPLDFKQCQEMPGSRQRSRISDRLAMPGRHNMLSSPYFADEENELREVASCPTSYGSSSSWHHPKHLPRNFKRQELLALFFRGNKGDAEADPWTQGGRKSGPGWSLEAPHGPRRRRIWTHLPSDSCRAQNLEQRRGAIHACWLERKCPSTPCPLNTPYS
ncbi:unnamed protein product [Nyctereutes procyonoides]|uniref:(raccoon dog) hypothetical protein n=1 Tax=Nyctereutes procyonoides TaxID=34880 RepID=A0A811Y1G0_NYCPR|nr:unnamed protein product [Nyctereutes procyonoides]